MQKIGMEKENIAGIVANSLLLGGCICALIAMCLLQAGIIPIIISAFFILLFLFGIIVESRESILYDESHFEVRSFAGKEKIDYGDIVKISRVYIRMTARVGGHWRYYVYIKADDEIKKVIVPFPQFIENIHLQDLFSKIKFANSQVQWSLPVNIQSNR